MNHNCKVISTYFGKRRFFPHNVDDTIETLKKVIEQEKILKSGIDNLDVIIINHDCEDDDGEKGKKFLQEINNTELSNGKLITLNRPWTNGIGASFLSFNYVFEKFRDKYEYWFFQEDDYMIVLDDYYKLGINMFKDNPNLAYVGYDKQFHAWGGIPIGDNPLNTAKTFIEHRILNTDKVSKAEKREIYQKYKNEIEESYNILGNIIANENEGKLGFCDGPNGLGNRKFLGKVYDKYGSLPYLKNKPNPGVTVQLDALKSKLDGGEAYTHYEYYIWHWLFIVLGEMNFTNIYRQMGYDIEFLNSEEKFLYAFKTKELR